MIDGGRLGAGLSWDGSPGLSWADHGRRPSCFAALGPIGPDDAVHRPRAARSASAAVPIVGALTVVFGGGALTVVFGGGDAHRRFRR